MYDNPWLKWQHLYKRWNQTGKGWRGKSNKTVTSLPGWPTTQHRRPGHRELLCCWGRIVWGASGIACRLFVGWFCLLFLRFISTSVLPECMSVHCMYVWCPWRPKEGIDSLELEVWAVVSAETQTWMGPLQEQYLTTTVSPAVGFALLFLGSILKFYEDLCCWTSISRLPRSSVGWVVLETVGQ